MSNSSTHFPATLSAALTASSVLLLAACAGAPSASMFSQAALPTAVQAPAGHAVALQTVGSGEITCECRDKAGAAGRYEWAFVGPVAALTDRQGRSVGRYFGPPATWAAKDGSSLTGTQLAVAPAGAGNIACSWSRPTRRWAPAR